jgi:hypothetical protein
MSVQSVPDDQDHLGRGAGYLSAQSSGPAWMLDPADPVLQRHADRQSLGPNNAADYRDFIEDAAALKYLMRTRHVAVVLDPDKAHATDGIIDRWAQGLSASKPTTLAGCVGSLGRELGKALGDGHLHVRHGEHHGREKETLGEDPGPAWETTTMDSIRIIRVRTFDGSDGVDSVLQAGAENHAEDFTFQDIIVDLRGNGGGDDSYITSWFTPHVNESWTRPCEERGMTLSSSGSPIVYWNHATWLRLNHHTVPAAFTAEHLRPRHDDCVIVTASQNDANHSETTLEPGRTEHWQGRMIVVIDGGTGSSGESAALLLKNVFDAVLVGAPSYGIIDYGNSTPYYLPTSGMQIHVPSQANNWGTAIDFVGIQPDVPLPASTPLRDITNIFDEIHNSGRTEVHS